MIDISILIPDIISDAVDKVDEINNEYTVALAEYELDQSYERKGILSEIHYRLTDAKIRAYDLLIQWIDPQDMEEEI